MTSVSLSITQKKREEKREKKKTRRHTAWPGWFQELSGQPQTRGGGGGGVPQFIGLDYGHVLQQKGEESHDETEFGIQ